MWIAEVAKQRLDQMQDPELSIEQAIYDYRRLGYSENWSHCLRGISKGFSKDNDFKVLFKQGAVDAYL